MAELASQKDITLEDHHDEVEKEDDLLLRYREQRLSELKRLAEYSLPKEYKTVEDGKLFLELTTTLGRVICHFYKDSFQRCHIMDRHLFQLAKFHPECQFIRMNVDHASFFVEKLKIYELPCVVLFLEGIAIDRLIGFEELGNTDHFSTHQLETRLVKSKVIYDKTFSQSFLAKNEFSIDYSRLGDDDEGSDDNNEDEI